jgi:hypothetical protein
MTNFMVHPIYEVARESHFAHQQSFLMTALLVFIFPKIILFCFPG